MKRTLLNFFLVVFGLYAGICLLMYVFQERLVYYPLATLDVVPSEVGLAYEELELQAADGVRIHGWFLPAMDPRGAVLFCHGNGGNISHRVEAARTFLSMELSVLLFDYRGYGRSGGSPGEEGTYLDAEAAYDELVRRGFPAGEILLYGESLGGAVGFELVRRRPLGALVAESAFSSLPEMGARLYPWLPVRWLSRYRYDNEAKIRGISIPLLLIHSPDDELVPFSHAETLIAAAPVGTRLLRTEAGHNDGGFRRRASWCREVESFVAAALDVGE